MKFNCSTLGVLALSVGALLAACSRQPPTDQDAITKPAIEVNSDSADRPAATDVADTDLEGDHASLGDCSLMALMSTAGALVDTQGANLGEAFKAADGAEFLTVDIVDKVRKAVQLDTMAPTVKDSSRDLDDLVLTNRSDFVNAQTFDTGPSVLIVEYRLVSRDQLRPVVTGQLVGSDGTLTLNGPCAEKWNSRLSVGAESIGRRLDLDFYANLHNWEGDEAIAVNSPRPSVDADQVWLAAEPKSRSLDVNEVPVSAMDNYRLLGLYIDPTPRDVAEGYIALRSSEGTSLIFATHGVEGVLPIFVPNDTPVRVTYVADPTLGPDSGDEIAQLAPDQFDEVNGSRLTVATAGGRITVVVTPLAPGELSKLSGISADVLDRYRQSILSGNGLAGS